jgi:hypothetical protein
VTAGSHSVDVEEDRQSESGEASHLRCIELRTTLSVARCPVAKDILSNPLAMQFGEGRCNGVELVEQVIDVLPNIEGFETLCR